MNESSLTQLNERQREAVTSVDGPVLVIAGAGSGKTRVLTERIAHLLGEHQVPPWNILAFTFTNKAAREMKDRIERSCPGISSALWVGTFHATGVRILRRHGERINIDRYFSIYDADDSLGLVKAILSRNIMDARVVKSPRSVRDTISRWKNDLITPEMAIERADAPGEDRLASIYAQYERELARAHALDFDDLISKVVELFSVDEEVRNHYAERFRYVLVDEFQDTNAIQMAMIEGLASSHGNLFVVGDDDQSIYSWRGARVEHILDFEQLYDNTRLIRLEQNYRSTKTILEAANQVIANNVGRKGKNLWTDGEKGDLIELLVSGDEQIEAMNVLQTVQREREAGTQLKDIAILYRTNAQSRALEEVLKMGSMPYQIIGSVRFYERMEVRDILAYCKVLVNPADTVSTKRVINVPKRGIGKTTFDRLENLARERDTSVIDVLASGKHDLPTAAAKRCAQFVKTMGQLQQIADSEVAPHVLQEIVDTVDYEGYLTEAYPDGEGRMENVEELISAAHAYAEAAEDRSLRGFLEEIALVAEVDSLDETQGQLTLMTLHNAKGLEFDSVIVTGLEDGLFPHFNSIDDEKAVEEERRLFYVGMTRARKKLYLSYAHMRRRMGHIEGGYPSRFLYEIPDQCLTQTMESLAGGGPEVAGAAAARTGWGDEFDQSAGQFDEFSQEQRSYEVGMRISHENFGKGVVRRVEGRGDQIRVTVLFDSGGERKFLAQYAPMRPL